MIKLSIFAGTTIVGYVAWWGADALGCSFFTSFLISGIGSVVGVWVGWKVGRAFE